jgi:xanthine dehydrogenase YagS FAD-binding subunit
MTPFSYVRAGDPADALRLGAGSATAYLGGGTNLVDLMRETIERPNALVDVTGLSTAIDEREDGSLLIGAAARNTAVAEHRSVKARYPMLARACGRRIGANSQHGDGRWQPAAANTLRLLLR